MSVSDCLYYYLEKRLKRFICLECKEDIVIYIYDETSDDIEVFFSKYLHNFDEDEYIFSYARKGMCGWYNTVESEGCFYISLYYGAIERNPLLPLFCSMSVFLIHHNAMLLHGAAVKYKNDVHIFTGFSGAGKTTITSMLAESRHVEVISDDTVVLRISDNVVEVYETPFWDIVPSSSSNGTLKSINGIVQSTTTKVISLGRTEFMSCMLRNAFLRISKKRYPKHWESLMEVCSSISRKCIYNKVYFEKNLNFWGDIINEKEVL
jgi:hypothetical protein